MGIKINYLTKDYLLYELYFRGIKVGDVKLLNRKMNLRNLEN